MLAVALSYQNGVHPAGHARTAQPRITNHERHESHEKTLPTKPQTNGIHAPLARHQYSNGKTVGEREHATEAKPRDNHAPSPAPSPQIARRCAAESRLTIQGFTAPNEAVEFELRKANDTPARFEPQTKVCRRPSVKTMLADPMNYFNGVPVITCHQNAMPERSNDRIMKPTMPQPSNAPRSFCRALCFRLAITSGFSGNSSIRCAAPRI